MQHEPHSILLVKTHLKDNYTTVGRNVKGKMSDRKEFDNFHFLGSSFHLSQSYCFTVLLGPLLETFVWILDHILKPITWSLYTIKTSYLVKWPISTWSFMWWCQFIDQLKFQTHPSSLLNFGTANSFNSKPFSAVSLHTYIAGSYLILLCPFDGGLLGCLSQT